MSEGCSGLDKTDSMRSEESVTSFTSDDLEESINEIKKYKEAPHDIFYEVENEQVRVLKQGESVPCQTKYKKMKNGTAAVKFG